MGFWLGIQCHIYKCQCSLPPPNLGSKFYHFFLKMLSSSHFILLLGLFSCIQWFAWLYPTRQVGFLHFFTLFFVVVAMFHWLNDSELHTSWCLPSLSLALWLLLSVDFLPMSPCPSALEFQFCPFSCFLSLGWTSYFDWVLFPCFWLVDYPLSWSLWKMTILNEVSRSWQSSISLESVSDVYPL